MKRRRPDAALFISIALHVVLGAALLWVLGLPYPVEQWLAEHASETEKLPVERISFVQLPNKGPATPGRAGGNGRPVTTHRPKPAPPLVAPTTVPTAVPPAPTNPAPAQPEAGTGPVVGGGGEGTGIIPSYSDPRVWLPPGPVVSAPKTPTQRLDSVLANDVARVEDSLAMVAKSQGRDPHDWTFEKNGKKYGLDQHNIYIGGVKIPSAILALLPLSKGNNPILAKQEAAYDFQRREIFENAQRAMNEDEFREAVKRIRERKDRERKDAQDAAKKGTAAVGPTQDQNTSAQP